MFLSRLNQSLGILFLVLTFQQSNAQAPRIVINPMGHSAKIHNLLFTPDGKKIISISEDKTIRLWNAENGEMDKKFESEIGDGPEGMLYASALSPNGKLLAVAGYKVDSEKDNYIIIIDVEKGVQVSTAIGHTDVILSLSFNGAGTYLASGGADNSVKIWKVDNEPILKLVTTIPIPSAVSCVSFNSRTQDLAVSHESKDILVFSLSGLDKGVIKFQPRVLKKHKENIDKVVFSPDGDYMASSSLDNGLILWRADGSVVKEFDRLTNTINAIAFSSDSKILVGLDIAGKGMSWKVPEGAKFTDYAAHDNTVFSAAFSPTSNGNYIVASAGGTNNEILLWNPINGMTIRRIKGKGSAIQDLGFGEGLNLFICRDITKNGKPQFKSSFDFASLTVNRNPATYSSSAKDYNKDLIQISENSIELSKGKVIETDPNQDGRILDFQGMADGNVVVASDFSLKMFDKNGFLNKEFIGHYGAIRSIAISNDGKYLASGGEDQSIILWKLSETGHAPSMRKAYEGLGDDWTKFFDSLPMDSLTREPSKAAWLTVIAFLKANGDKTYKSLEETFHSLGETVIPFTTLFVTEDNEWVCWTPRGYFSCSSSGSQYFGWHLNRGIKKLADFYAAEQYFEILYRPKQMEKSIIQGKRVEDILRESGERIFDLSKTQRPSAAFFDINPTLRSTDLLWHDKGKFYTQAKTIPLTVEVFDGGGGIKEINIYQNDKLIISDEQNLKTKGEDDKIVRTYAVDMANENNVFRVKVINLQKIESRADEIDIEYKGEVIATSVLHVLTVGINQYQNSAYNLNYAQSDAQAFMDKVKEKGKTIFKRVNSIGIYDQDATKENIMKGFKAIAASAKPEDLFIFYYAGHGTIDEDNAEEFYFVPTDVTKLYGDPKQLQTKAISMNEVRAMFTQVKAQKLLMLLDACHSGAALKNFNVRGGATDEKAIVQLARSTGIVAIASSGSKQYATEFEELKHGVFTYALLEAMDGKGDNGDKKLTVNELKFYMEDRVPELTKQYGGTAQYPTGYITGNDFPITVIEKP